MALQSFKVSYLSGSEAGKVSWKSPSKLPLLNIGVKEKDNCRIIHP